MTEYLADSNTLLDIVTGDPVWLSWSEEQSRFASEQGRIFINPLIYAELAPAFQTEADLEKWFESTELICSPLPLAAAWPAAQAFLRYKKMGGAKTSPLPNFYIGAHAHVEGLTLITRDAARYRTYFPGVALISAPEASPS